MCATSLWPLLTASRRSVIAASPVQGELLSVGHWLEVAAGGDFSSSGQFQPALMASRREATAWPANAAASAAVTPDFASAPNSASRASACDRSNPHFSGCDARPAK